MPSKKQSKAVQKRKDGDPTKSKYVMMEHTEHVLVRPGSYIGSDKLETKTQYVLDESGEYPQIVNREFEYCPGFNKCYDELLVNAFDHTKRQKKAYLNGNKKIQRVTKIHITINQEQNYVEIMNDGDGIDVEIIPEYQLYPITMIFGKLLTSSNYDDDEDREWGGKNGYGAKLANIFSTQMTVESVDKVRKLKFTQTFRNNMKITEDPVIVPYTGKPYTKITWYPDYHRFSMTGLDDDHAALLKKRAYDIAACTDPEVKVYLNGKQIKEKTFEEYVNLYIGTPQEQGRVFMEEDGWSVVATHNHSEEFEQVSFVNGVNTIRGGKHVEYVCEQIREKLAALIKKRHKINVRPSYVKNQLLLFVNSTIVNPSFDGQTKETLKTNRAQFKHYITITDKFIDRLYKTKITDLIIAHATYKENKTLEKTDGKKRSKIKVPKLSDAVYAGTRKARECTLILTEGDSAKSMAIAGLSVIGREYWGVFPLRGKVLNVRDAKSNTILNNAEISNIKKIIGLQSNKVYNTGAADSRWPLRYGKIMIMTDQDLDGSHIKGLVINLFDHMWPSLLHNGFICSMITPILKLKKTSGKQEKVFYTLQDFEVWKQTNSLRGWKTKYYKGLGTSTTSEAKEYFKKLKIVDYIADNPPTSAQVGGGDDVQQPPSASELQNSIDLAFRKDRANERKTWLLGYDRDVIPDFNQPKMTLKDFINTELIHFSHYDVERSIPDIRDGFKPSLRKIMYSCFKKNIKHEIKVSQLAGYVSENSGYHHGEHSLEGAIVGLAHDFTGSNNLNLLMPGGQFGTRLMGGKDAAQSRYIHTNLNPITRILFNEKDEPLYNYLDDDGYKIEPEAYSPILPHVLINGAKGIGTGFSTEIPCFNPLDIAENIRKTLQGKPTVSLTPWYRHFQGTVDKIDEDTFLTRGVMKKVDRNVLRITELPIGRWTEKYIQFLDDITIEKSKPNSKQFIKGYIDNSTESTVHIDIHFNPYCLDKLLQMDSKDPDISHLEKLFKMTSRVKLSNMWLFNTTGNITKYESVDDIIAEWVPHRLSMYQKRKDFLLGRLQKELNIIKYKVKFIEEIIAETITIRNMKKADIYALLEEKQYPQLSLKIQESEGVLSYDYLLKMDLYKLTQEEIAELRKKHENKEMEVKALESTEPSQMWLKEIKIFETEYKKILRLDAKKLTASLKLAQSSKTNKSKKTKAKGKGKHKGKAKPALKSR